MMLRRANFSFKESAPLFPILRKCSHRSFHSILATGATAGITLQSLHDMLGRNDAVANGALFESQVLAGSSSLNEVYLCLDSQKVVASIAHNIEENAGGSKLNTQEQGDSLKQAADVFAKVKPTHKKLAQYAKTGVPGTDLQVDGFFALIAKDPEYALEKLQEFLMQTATKYCRLNCESPLRPLSHDTKLCPNAPSFVIIEVCVTGEKAAHKMFQLAKDYYASKNLAVHYKVQHRPLLILYLNGNVARANAAISEVRKVLENVEDTSLRNALKHTVVLHTPFRNVYEALNKFQTDIRKDLDHIRSDLNNRDARMRKDLDSRDARMRKDLDSRDARMRKDLDHIRGDLGHFRKDLKHLMEMTASLQDKRKSA